MTFSDLETGKYYLIRTDEESDIELVTVLMHTAACVLLRSFLPELQDFFIEKEDEVFSVIEEVDEFTIEAFNKIYEEEGDFDELEEYYTDEDNETDDDVFDDEEKDEDGYFDDDEKTVR